MNFFYFTLGLISLCSAKSMTDEELAKRINLRMFTRTQRTPYLLTLQDSSDYVRRNIRKPFKFVIHGWLDGWSQNHLLDVSSMTITGRERLLNTEDVVVIVVDWSSMALSPFYFTATIRTKAVGGYLAQLIDQLIALGASPSQFHLIGHSLGAHVAGFAGAGVTKGKIARITGLDPALPDFKDVPPNVRLDPTDADFVDVIHTCSGLMGIELPIGHADFYPNGGRNSQPGCKIPFDLGFCSHVRAPLYFFESIDPKHKFQAYPCPTIPFKGVTGCAWSNFTMGYYTDPKARGLFYVETHSQQPYAKLIQ